MCTCAHKNIPYLYTKEAWSSDTSRTMSTRSAPILASKYHFPLKKIGASLKVKSGTLYCATYKKSIQRCMSK